MSDAKQPPHVPDPQLDAPAARPPAQRSRTRRILGVLMTAGLTLLIVGGVGLAGAEYYTAQPKFCGTCHVMDPYYESWSHDLHGRKLGVRCVDCHYAPGERFTIKAKFKGLSQVASYFSGRYGTGRPRAHVSDDSCLTSACHGDQAFMTKKLTIGEAREDIRLVDGIETKIQREPTVSFFHEKHLQADAKLTQVDVEREATTARLRAALDPAAFEKVSALTKSVAPAAERNTALASLLDQIAARDAVRVDARALLDLEHRRIRLKQLGGASCSTCHNYDPTGTNHISVNRQNCYTCHFTNEGFNHGTGECLKCHEPPTRLISVHSASATTTSPVLMDHRDIVNRNVDCASCHLDVIRGDSAVTVRECRNCHDQDRFIVDFATRTTETVEKYHEAHVGHQKARCDDCHRSVSHGLLDPVRETASGFLKPVLDDCQHCHPGHHREQVQMLAGIGGAEGGRDTPNAMLGSRLNCRACHVMSGEDTKGDSVVKATEQSCIACHTDNYATLFAQQRSELDTAMQETKELLARVEKLAATAANVTSALREKIDLAKQNIHFVETAGGMHNKHYASRLLDTARRDLAEVEQSLDAAPQ